MEKRHPNHPGDLSTHESAAIKNRPLEEIEARACAIDLLQKENVPFLVGGAYAFSQYTGIYRDTKDLDLFIKRADVDHALEVLATNGYQLEKTDERWIYKALRGEYFVDFIFSSGNGVAVIDDLWFQFSVPGKAFGRAVRLIPAEEMIWSKAFVLERERFDGADVAHVIRAMGPKLDWPRLLARFDAYWEVLFSHLMLFRFAYPCERTSVPDWVMAHFLGRTVQTVEDGDAKIRVCRGNLMSRSNYALDLKEWGYLDGRALDELERNRGGSDRDRKEASLGSRGRSTLP